MNDTNELGLTKGLVVLLAEVHQIGQSHFLRKKRLQDLTCARSGFYHTLFVKQVSVDLPGSRSWRL